MGVAMSCQRELLSAVNGSGCQLMTAGQGRRRKAASYCLDFSNGCPPGGGVTVNKKYRETLQSIRGFARQEENIMAVPAIDSPFRQEFPGDEWPDLDIIMLVNDTAAYIETEAWTARFGAVVCASKEVVDLHIPEVLSPLLSLLASLRIPR